MPQIETKAEPKELQAFFDCPRCGREFAQYVGFRRVQSKYGVRFEGVPLEYEDPYEAEVE